MQSMTALFRPSSVPSLGILIVAGLCATTAHAHDGTWKIIRISGDVRLTDDGVTLATISEGMTIRSGASIRTSGNGRVMLSHAGESMMISPNSSITIPDSFKSNGYTTLLQRRGSVFFEVEKDQGRPFQVLTPYLAAVVKGTQFTVTLTPSDHNVTVEEGRVEVTEFRSGQTGLVAAGQSALVATDSIGLRVVGAGFVQPIRQGAPLPPPEIPDIDSESYTEAGLEEFRYSPDHSSSSQALGHRSLPGTNADSDFRSDSTFVSVGGISGWFSPRFEWANQLAIPVVVGFGVAFGVAVRNRSKNLSKDKSNDKKSNENK